MESRQKRINHIHTGHVDISIFRRISDFCEGKQRGKVANVLLVSGL